MKQIRFLLAVLMAFVFTARAWAQTEEAYAVLNKGRLSFYYDESKNTQTGTVFPIPWEGDQPGWTKDDYPASITSVSFTPSFKSYDGLTTTSYMFVDLQNITSLDLSYLNTDNVIDMSSMFAGCTSLEKIEGLDCTTNVKDMSWMFYLCESLKSLDLSGLNTSNVTNMSYMFANSGVTSLDLSGFDTGNVTDMNYMLSTCGQLTDVNLSSFNTENVVNMSGMFYQSDQLRILDLTNFNIESVTDIRWMFALATNLRVIYCDDDWNIPGKSVNSEDMFQSNIFLKGAVDFDENKANNITYANPTTGYFTGSKAYAVYNGTDYSVTFYYDFNKSKHEDNPDEEVLDVVDHDFIRYNNISSVTIDKSFKDYYGLTSTRNMFANLPVEEIVGLANLNTENVTDMSGMFSACTRLKSLDLKTFDTGKVTNMGYMFSSCRALTTIYCYDNWQKSGLNSYYMFYGCNALKGAADFDGTKTDAGMANPDTGYFSRYESIAIDATSFPDDNFRAWILQQSYGQDGVLTLSEANQVTEIRVPEMHIADLTGIELFPNLTDLICHYNELTSLDLSHNPKVGFLACNNNRLSSLIVTGCALTSDFSCFGNQLAGEAMDALINSMPTLGENNRHSIQIYDEKIDEGNRLTRDQVDALLAKGWGITFYLDDLFDLNGEQVRFVGITERGQVPIAKLFFPDANFRTWLYQQTYGADRKLTAEEIEATKSIDVSAEGISDLTGLEFFSALTDLNCEANWNLSTLDVSPFRDLENLKCNTNALTSLDVSMARSLKTLNCSYNKLTSLTFGEMNGSLEDVNCSHNQLTSLDVSECPALTYLYCHNNQIAGEAMGALVGSLPDRSQTEGRRGFLDVVNKNSTAEQNVITMQQAAVADGKRWEVYGFDIPIDETTFPDEVFRSEISQTFGEELSPLELYYETGLHIENTWEIHDITGIEYFTELKSLTCVGSQITKLDVSQNTKLLELSVEKNHLTALDVSNNPDLRFISVYGNNIHGAAMSAFVESLPTVEGGELYIWDESEDGNVITVDQVAMAKAKGWAVLDRSGYDYAGVPVEKGDANGDGELTIDDAVAVANSIIGQGTVNSTAADVNNDGEVTIADAAIIINNVLVADAKAKLTQDVITCNAILDICIDQLDKLDVHRAQTELWEMLSRIDAEIEAVEAEVANAATEDDIRHCQDNIVSIEGELATLRMRIVELEAENHNQ